MDFTLGGWNVNCEKWFISIGIRERFWYHSKNKKHNTTHSDTQYNTKLNSETQYNTKLHSGTQHNINLHSDTKYNIQYENVSAFSLLFCMSLTICRCTWVIGVVVLFYICFFSQFGLYLDHSVLFSSVLKWRLYS